MSILIKNVEDFNNAIKNAGLSVVHFAADWADQCKQVDEVIDALSKRNEYSNVKFYKVDAEEQSDVSLKHKIEAVPTVILFQSGKSIDRVDGIDAAQIAEKVKAHCSKAEVDKSIPLEERLKTLINKSPVMLFMKGDRDAPRCGFSKQIIHILNETGVPYDTFDILTDEEVRQGLKTYSDWPTYPQLYVKGDLIGGLDIIKEMLAAGDLITTLKA